eukprot:5799735-Pleurochrysis_carterae.AAC.1
MHSFPIAFKSHAYLRSARAPTAPQYLEPSLAYGRRHPLSALDRSRPVGALSPRACACSLPVPARVSDRVAINCPPRSVALSDPKVVYIYKVRAKRRRA